MGLPGRCSFGGVRFDVDGGDGVLPFPARGDDGLTTIDLRLLLGSWADTRALARLQSRVTPRASTGGFGGTVVVHAGPGALPLVLPLGAAMAPATFDAILTAFAPERPDTTDAVFRASATFAVLSDPWA